MINPLRSVVRAVRVVLSSIGIIKLMLRSYRIHNIISMTLSLIMEVSLGDSHVCAGKHKPTCVLRRGICSNLSNHRVPIHGCVSAISMSFYIDQSILVCKSAVSRKLQVSKRWWTYAVYVTLVSRAAAGRMIIKWPAELSTG
jgi:hypothetical protein